MARPTTKEGSFTPAGIGRAWRPHTVVGVGATEEAAEVLEIFSMAGGCVEIPAGSSITSLTFYASTENSGTFYPLYSTLNAAVTLTVAHTRVYALPDEVYNVPFIKMVGNAAGDVNVFLKG